MSHICSYEPKSISILVASPNILLPHALWIYRKKKDKERMTKHSTRYSTLTFSIQVVTIG